MITVTEKEFQDMKLSAKATLMAKAKSAKCYMQKGGDVGELYLQLSASVCNMVSINHFITGKFDSAEYFNIINPFDLSRMFSNSNTVNLK